ncbi:MAG: C45 family autoproteolytic acyltransferase/hydrolase [Planctomycetota bacterium]
MARLFHRGWSGAFFTALLLASSFVGVARGADEGQRLATELRQLFQPAITGRSVAPQGTPGKSSAWQAFSLAVEARVPIDGRPQDVTLRLDRHGEQAFDLDVKHQDYWVQIRRRADVTSLVLPYHKKQFVGTGATNQVDHLAPLGAIDRLISDGSLVSQFKSLLTTEDPAAAAPLLSLLLGLKYDEQASAFRIGKDVVIRFEKEPRKLVVEAGEVRVAARFDAAKEPRSVDTPAGFQKVDLNRGELELTLARGLRRALEVLLPGPALTSPAESNLQVAHGSRRWVDGQRLVTLHGTPEQIGKAHGELLREESLRCVDSVLYAFGTVQTIVNGRWFRHDLESAYERLARHIPDDHRRETRALAASLNIPAQVAEVVNVFPEMFHCSGFAVFGKATKDGKMYHGRVLDYMTTIGLQDAATTMVIAVDGKIPFVTVGYGGFIGSVSGMNIQAISLGEMGGRGEGKWDGVPMATLMRRALEECTTLDQVMDLWKKSPRTCEYYYVFADGKTKRAVGVAAVPEQIEFLQPGQSDPRLGDGIPDTVVLSAGDRLQKLRERVQKKYGEIDVEAAQWLMSQPVAMTSNLHNVLFVPEDRVLYVANADHRHPAAERPYVKFDLRKLIQELPAKVQ